MMPIVLANVVGELTPKLVWLRTPLWIAAVIEPRPAEDVLGQSVKTGVMANVVGQLTPRLVMIRTTLLFVAIIEPRTVEDVLGRPVKAGVMAYVSGSPPTVYLSNEHSEVYVRA